MNKLLDGLNKLVIDLRNIDLSDEQISDLLKKTKDKALTPKDLEIFEKINSQVE